MDNFWEIITNTALLRKDQNTALLLASRKGHAEVVAQLLTRGADTEAEDKVCALGMADAVP